MDAGATAIGKKAPHHRNAESEATNNCLCKDVRFKNQGLDSIEVQDNGSGISAENYQSIALKHYTSKLSTYDDLSNLQTFGFRGEALSSLCALSNFCITTCTQKDAPRAKKLEFESSGKLKSTSIVSGQKGTTVVVENLFHNLPVRRRELERNIKREWTKVINQLNQYACIQTGIKFTVSQQPTKGKRMVLFSTKGNPTTRENIINIFGVKTMVALVPLDLKLELTPTTGPLGKGKAKADGSTTEVRVQGHVSRPVHGEGRQTPDRQMFYINGRPCGLPQFAKVFNEVYRSYNSSQSPFIFADIQLDTHLYDVNVSPDKRTILLHDQGQMLDNLRESLIELFEMQDVTIPIAQTPLKTGHDSRSSTPASAQGVTSGGGISHRTPGTTGFTTSNLSMADRESEPESEDEDDGDKSDIDEKNGGASRRATRNPDPPKSSKSQTESLLARWLEKKSDPRDKLKPHEENKDLSSDTKPQPVLNPSKREDSHDNSMSDVQPGSSGDDDGPPSYQANKEDAQTQQTDDEMEMEVERDELPVPAIPPPSQPPASKPGFIPASRMLNRSTQEVATITIGEDSVTSVIGSTAKRPRIAGESSTAKPLSSAKPPTRTVPLPSFGGRLSQLFSASAAVRDEQVRDLDIETEDVEISVDEEEEEEEEEDGGEVEKDQEEEEDSLFVSQSENSGRDSEHDDHTKDPGDTDLLGDLEESEAGGLDQREDEETVPSETGGQIGSRESSPPAHCEHGDHENEDEEYIDEDEKKVREDQKVKQMIDAAEATTSKSTEEGEKRTQIFLKGRQKRKDTTLNLVQHLNVDSGALSKSLATWINHLPPPAKPSEKTSSPGGSDGLELEEDIAELKLALKISKSDFAKMRVVGQFNLGFVLAVREKNTDTNANSSTSPSTPEETQDDDELFIIDQHASDEKYNFERLQSTTTVQSQRLVQPKTLELTALEEEIIIENLTALESNGFTVQVDQTGDKPVGSRCMLTSLPLSRETVFSVADLEELIFLLAENPTTSSTTIPRPSKVRKMFAMRACRSSIMIGRALSRKQMEKVVRHMGEMEKPWNCPHGRPTMRHLCGLGTAWDQKVWVEGDWVCSGDVDSDEEEEGGDGVRHLGNTRRKTDWAAWVKEKRRR